MGNANMKILFFGDSATDAKRLRSNDDAGRVPEEYSNEPRALGSGYVFLIAAELYTEKPNYYQILNRGIGGDRLPQLYGRINLDVWREKPDVLNIWVGGNDMPREKNPNSTDLKRWGRLYRMMIEETLERLPDTKILICEPWWPRPAYKQIASEYAAEAKKIAQEFNLPFVSLMDKLEKAVEVYGYDTCYYDGVHPSVEACKIIADEWLRVFKEQVVKE